MKTTYRLYTNCGTLWYTRGNNRRPYFSLCNGMLREYFSIPAGTRRARLVLSNFRPNGYRGQNDPYTYRGCRVDGISEVEFHLAAGTHHQWVPRALAIEVERHAQAGAGTCYAWLELEE